METGTNQLDALWLRGGFPESLTASSEVRSLRWRQNFVRTYLERDIPQFGPRIAAETLRRFVIENLLACASANVQAYFYRTSGGAEVDLLLAWPGGLAWWRPLGHRDQTQLDPQS